MRELVRRMLERADHIVVDAEDGEAGAGGLPTTPARHMLPQAAALPR
jgi:hypothetical protein